MPESKVSQPPNLTECTSSYKQKNTSLFSLLKSVFNNPATKKKKKKINLDCNEDTKKLTKGTISLMTILG